MLKMLARNIAIIFFSLLIRCPVIFAHGTAAHWLDSSKDQTLSIAFSYSTGEPMAAVKINVYGPNKTKFITAQTDRNGKFAFLPDQPGLWRVEAYDADGHKAVAAKMFQSITTTSKDPTNYYWLKGLLGLSLILNIFVLIRTIRQRTGRK